VDTSASCNIVWNPGCFLYKCFDGANFNSTHNIAIDDKADFKASELIGSSQQIIVSIGSRIHVSFHIERFIANSVGIENNKRQKSWSLWLGSTAGINIFTK